MTRVLLTGGSGFIAAHVLDILLEHGHSVVTTVRSQEKANKIKEAHPEASEKQLSFAIVEDIAQEGAFDKAVVSDPPFQAVIHTASPFHFNVTDIQKVSHISPLQDVQSFRSWMCQCMLPVLLQ
jgi:nucleoside-diphosphate-sugar epimerase